MDRHDVSDSVTAETVARVHQEDLKVQDQFNCRGFTYWFDGKRKMAFCLIEAPDMESVTDSSLNVIDDAPFRTIMVISLRLVQLLLSLPEFPLRMDYLLL